MFRRVPVGVLFLAVATLGCGSRTLLPAGAEPTSDSIRDAVYGVVWRSTALDTTDLIMGATVNFAGPPSSDGTPTIVLTAPQRISAVAGTAPRLVRVSDTQLFAAWRAADAVYGSYLSAADMSPLPGELPLRLDPSGSGALAGFDIAFSEAENRVVLVTGRADGVQDLYEITRTPSGSPPFRSVRFTTLSAVSTGPRYRVPRIAIGQPGGSTTILVTTLPAAGLSRVDYHLVYADRTSFGDSLDSAPSMGWVTRQAGVYDGPHERFLVAMSGGGEIYTAIVYPDGTRSRNARVALPDFAPTAPEDTTGPEEGTVTRYRIGESAIELEDVAATGSGSGSVFALAHVEYHTVIATKSWPSPPRVTTTTVSYQTFYTNGLDALGALVGSRVVRGPVGRRDRQVMAALSTTPGTFHAIVIGSDVAIHVERYEQR